MIENNEINEKAVIVGADIKEKYFSAKLEELKELALACNIDVVHTITQNLEKINPALYIGTGKVEELKEYISQNDVDLVIFDNELSPSQIKNLQKILDIKILDRTSLILQIFARRAKTKEAKLQVEVASLEYMLPRLVGLKTSLGRQGGKSGFSNKGTGEKQIELDRRKIEERLVELNKELKNIENERKIQRRKREASDIPLVCLVGYTNAGKSTILNMFVQKYMQDETKKVLEKDMLFATLDTSVRKITEENKKTFLLSDTVGFVSNIPHNLIKAFRSTLEEVKEASLLIHVVDYSDENYLKNIEVTNNTLKEIGADDIPVIYAFNKADLMHIKIPRVEEDIVYMSASNKIGDSELVELISKKLFGKYIKTKMLIPYSKGSIYSYINENAIIEKIEYEEKGTLLTLSLKEKDYNKYNEYIIEN